MLTPKDSCEPFASHAVIFMLNSWIKNEPTEV